MSIPSTALDVVVLLVRWFAPMAIGSIHTNGAARLRRDGEALWTLGRARDSFDRQGDIADIIGTVTGDAEAVARAFAAAHPKAADFILSSEQSRLRYVAEGLVRKIKGAEEYRKKTTRLSADLLAHMAAEGDAGLWLAEPYTEQGAWGDTDGYVVYADSQATADRVARWLCRGGSRAASSFLGTKPAGVPFAAFAGLSYYSIGD
jgi:hypothetical protein